MLRIAFALPIACWLMPLLTAAEAPKVDRLFPPGLQMGSSAEIKLVGKPGDQELHVWPATEQLSFEFSEKRDSARVTASSDITPGVHWLRFYNQTGTSEPVPLIVGVNPEVIEAEPNNDVATAQHINATSTTINGVLEKTGDVDVFRLELKAGKTLVASVLANREPGSPVDTVLQLLDAGGTILQHNDDDHGFDPQIVTNVPEDGVYFVRIFGFPSAPNSSIRLAGSASYVYQLTLTTGAFIDHVSPAAVNSDVETTVTVYGWNLTEDLRSFRVSPFNTEESVVFGNYANWYRLPRTTSNASKESEIRETTVPASVTGTINTAGEVDTYQFPGTSGQKLTVSVSSRDQYSQLDPVLTILDNKGNVLKEADDRSKSDLDAEASVTLKSDGLYSVQITDRYGSGSERHYYVLHCQETTTGFSASVSASSFTVQDKAVEIRVSITRSNGFAEPIVVTAHGLPDGISAQAVTSEKDGDSAKAVTLTLTPAAETMAFQGPVQIHCISQPSNITHQAIFTNSAGSYATEELWLTVQKSDNPDESAAAESKTE